MTPAWSLSVLLLGFAFGIPVPSVNDTRQQDQTIDNLQRDNKVDNSTGYESSVQVNGTLGNLTQHFQPNDTRNDTGIIPFMIILPMPNLEDPSTEHVLQGQGCFVATCVTTQLSSSMQAGDEKAGDATRDPFGMGK